MVTFGSPCDGLLDQRLIDIQSICSNVHKDRYHASQHEGVRGGGEGVGWHDDLC